MRPFGPSRCISLFAFHKAEIEFKAPLNRISQREFDFTGYQLSARNTAQVRIQRLRRESAWVRAASRRIDRPRRGDGVAERVLTEQGSRTRRQEQTDGAIRNIL